MSAKTKGNLYKRYARERDLVEDLCERMEKLEQENNRLRSACGEALRYFRNRPGNEETQLNEILGTALAHTEGGRIDDDL